MRWIATHRLVHKLRTENSETVAVIRIHHGQYLCQDINGNMLFSVYRENESSFIIRFEDEQIKASLAHDTTHSIFCLPPRARTVAFSWKKQTITITQTEKRTFTLASETMNGRITGMLRLKAIAVYSSNCVGIAALFYLFSYIMLHEDDVDIV